MSSYERIGLRIYIDVVPTEFRATTDQVALCHLPTKGGSFTWINGRFGREWVETRLGIALVKDRWSEKWLSMICNYILRARPSCVGSQIAPFKIPRATISFIGFMDESSGLHRPSSSYLEQSYSRNNPCFHYMAAYHIMRFIPKNALCGATLFSPNLCIGHIVGWSHNGLIAIKRNKPKRPVH